MSLITVDYGTVGGGDKVATGDLTVSSTTGTYSEVIGFKPKQLMVSSTGSNTLVWYYNEDVSTSQYKYNSSSTNTNLSLNQSGASHSNELCSIDNDGFTVNQCTNGYQNLHYIAIG